MLGRFSENYNRKPNVIITGVPGSSKNEKYDVVLKFLKDIGLEFSEADLVAYHRLSGKDSEAIIIRFINYDDKSLMFTCFKELTTFNQRRKLKVHITQDNSLAICPLWAKLLSMKRDFTKDMSIDQKKKSKVKYTQKFPFVEHVIDGEVKDAGIDDQIIMNYHRGLSTPGVAEYKESLFSQL